MPSISRSRSIGGTFIAGSLLLAAGMVVAQPDPGHFLSGQTVPVPAGAPIILADGRGIEAASSERGRTLHPNLSRLVEAHGRAAADLAAASNVPAVLLDGGRVLVEIRSGSATRAAGLVDRAGGSVRHARGGGVVEAWVPIAGLPALAAEDGVVRVWPAMLAQPQAGSETTQGLAAGRAGPWHAAGLDGSGATIAIIDNFDDDDGEVDDLQDSGDWPGSGQLTLEKIGSGSFGDNGNPHGNAVLEIAFDIAPGADFIAYDVLTIGDWIEAIDEAVGAGADVISASLGAPLDGIGDGTALPGSVAEAIEDAAEDGVLYVNSAGNSRRQHWGGEYESSGQPELHDWTGSGQQINYHGPGDGDAFCLADGAPLRGELFWADWGFTNDDYALLLFEYDGSSWQEIARSDFEQDGASGHTPQEFVSIAASSAFDGGCGPGSGLYGWGVLEVSVNLDLNLQFFSAIELDERVFNRSLTFPADSPAAIAVTALDVADAEQEPYSSQGPILAPGGDLPEGDEYPKPDVASFANVDTVSYGAGVFNGTSAAAPHVAGMLALLSQRHPVYSRDERLALLHDISAAGSNDLGDAGHEYRHGCGRTRFQLEESLAITQQPQDAQVGETIAPVEVELRDDEGLVVLSGPTTELTAAIEDDAAGGTANLSGTTTRALSGGRAGFDDLVIDATGADYTLVIASSGPGPVETDPFDITAGAAAQLAFDVQPSDAEAGQAISPAVVVEVLDAQGNLVAGDDSTEVTLSIARGPENAQLSGGGPITVSGGEARFDNLGIEKAGTGYRLAATDVGGALDAAESTSFAIEPGAPAALTFGAQPGETQVDEPVTPAITVNVVDSHGNVVSDENATFVELSLAAGPGDATLSGGGAVLAENGEAVFPDVSIDRIGEGYILEARDGALFLEAATSNAFDIIGGEPDRLAFVVQPSDNAVERPIEPTVTVEVLDADGNRVAWDDNIQVELRLSGGSSGNLSGGGPVNVTDGLAEFDALAVDAPGSDYELEAVDGAGALTPANSEPFDVIVDETFADRFEDQSQ